MDPDIVAPAPSRVYGALVSLVASWLRAARFVLSLSSVRWLASAFAPLGRAAISRLSLVDYAASSLKWGHSSCVKSVAVIGDHVYTGCWDFLVKKWDARTGACVLTFVGHRQDIIGIAVHGSSLFSCGDYCRLWDTETGDEIARFGVGTYYCAIANATHVFAARANGAIEMYAYADSDGRVTASGAVTTAERTLVGHLAGVMEFDMRGDMLVSASIDLTARAWSIETGELLQTFTVRAACHGRTARALENDERVMRAQGAQWPLARVCGHYGPRYASPRASPSAPRATVRT